jgi:hypothetical protein
MSLKAFHLVFISAASALAFGFGIWSLKSYRLPGGGAGDLALGLASMAAGVGLIVYERYFLKKLKNVSYL